MIMEPFYQEQVLLTIRDGWGNSHENLYFENGKYNCEEPMFDRMWGQSFYGIFVSKLEDETLKTKLIGDFIKGTNDMLKKTGGIFLRDNSDAAIELWKTDKYWEASKDQLIGFVCGIFAMYQSTTHEVLRGGLREIVRQLNDNLAWHKWIIYNETENRPYQSPNLVFMQYWGMQAAFEHIIGKRNRSWVEMFLYPIKKVFSSVALDMMWKTKTRAYWWQNIEWLKKYPWYGDYFRAGIYDFGLNLVFFEMYIVGNISKKNAEWILKQLERPVVMNCNNLNFAFLYFELERKWGIKGKNPAAYVHYNKLKLFDQELHPTQVIPNEARIGCIWEGADKEGERLLWSHQIYDYGSIIARQSVTRQTMSELKLHSMGRKVRVNNGLFFAARN